MNKRVVIVEDEFFVANHLRKILEANDYTIVAQYHDGETLIENLPFIENTVFLLDIQLSKNVTGVEIAVELNKRNLPFVYITANSEDLTFKNAIGTSPVSFISKPFKEIDVLASVALAAQKLNGKITIESGTDKLLIAPEDILYLKSEGNYIDVFTVKGTSHTIRKLLKNMEDELSNNFKRCHKSFIVNMDKVSLVKGGFVFLDKVKVPLSRTYKDDFS